MYEYRRTADYSTIFGGTVEVDTPEAWSSERGMLVRRRPVLETGMRDKSSKNRRLQSRFLQNSCGSTKILHG